MNDSGDGELVRERGFAERCRRALEAMRESTDRMRFDGGDAVLDKVTNAYLRDAKRARIRHLSDDAPDRPLFFGRIDYRDDHRDAPGAALHIGRRNIRESVDADPLIVDWRAPVARAFYRATTREPYGLARRRRFGFSGDVLTAYEDESLDADLDGQVSRLLTREIERPRTGPMRDIVATIQPDQDEIVRAPLETNVCVQGAPGTGKSAVALHRVAYLLYTYRRRLDAGDVAVIGPSGAFLRYIADVLPALGENSVMSTTVDDLVAAPQVCRTDDDVTGRLKGDARMATVIRRALGARIRGPEESVRIKHGARHWVIESTELAEIVDAVASTGPSHVTGRQKVALRVAGAVRTRAERAGKAVSDVEFTRLVRSAAVRSVVAAIWPSVSPAELVQTLLTSAPALADAARGVLDPAEQERLLASSPGPGRRVRWSREDHVLLDEAACLVSAPQAYRHVVVDEAQDLSAMAARAVGRRCSGSMTVVGDIAQGTAPGAAESWEALLGNLDRSGAAIEVLTHGYRVPRQILTYANSLLDRVAPTLAAATSARTVDGALHHVRVDHGDVEVATVREAKRLRERDGTLGIVAADSDVAELAERLGDLGIRPIDEASPQVSLVGVSLAKGLEFDHVIVVEPARIVGADDRAGFRRLYVAVTRSVTSLTIVHSDPLPT